MIKCHLCGHETAYPCGPKESEVCPSCWLAIGCDDMLCQAPDLQTALERIEIQNRANFIEWQDLVIENEEPAQVMEDSINSSQEGTKGSVQIMKRSNNSSQKIIDQAKTGRKAQP
jgi:hypothetical protein